MVLAILIAIGVSLTAVSADDEWSFNFSSAENSDGGSIDFENGVLKMQGIELTIPGGYKMDEDSKKLAEDATDADAKFSACKFVNGDDEIVVNVFFADTDFESLSLKMILKSIKPLAISTVYTKHIDMMTTLQHSLILTMEKSCKSMLLMMKS